jgi:hypothetical protein
MPDPWEFDDESWRGDEHPQDSEYEDDPFPPTHFDRMIINARYIFDVPRRGEGIRFLYRDCDRHILDRGDMILCKDRVLKFTAGIFLGQLNNCPWLPPHVKRALWLAPVHYGIFAGVPEGEKIEHLFIIQSYGGLIGKEFILVF